MGLVSDKRGTTMVLAFSAGDPAQAVALLQNTLLRLQDDAGVNVVVLAGLGAVGAGVGVEAAASLLRVAKGFSKPLLVTLEGAVSGWVLGLVAACDVVLAAPNARLVFAGEGVLLAAPLLRGALGETRLAALVLTAQSITAQEAHAFGLVFEVVPDAAVLSRALLVAAGVAQREAGFKKKLRDSL